jgi:hypothetical protein
MSVLDRRTFLLSTVAAATLPGVPAAQTRGGLAFAAKLRALAGFNPLPDPLVAGLTRAAEEAGLIDAVLEETRAPNAAQKRVLRAAYSGIWEGPGENAVPERLVFADALKWAAIAETNNVISWCGGVPGFWAEPPETPGALGDAGLAVPDGATPAPRAMGG